MVQDPQLTLATVHFQTWLICDLWMQVGAMAPWGNVTMETCEKNHLVNCDVARNTTGIVCLVDMYSICILGRSLPCVVFQMMRLGVPIETSSTPPVNRLANGARTEPCRSRRRELRNEKCHRRRFRGRKRLPVAARIRACIRAHMVCLEYGLLRIWFA